MPRTTTLGRLLQKTTPPVASANIGRRVVRTTLSRETADDDHDRDNNSNNNNNDDNSNMPTRRTSSSSSTSRPRYGIHGTPPPSEQRP